MRHNTSKYISDQGQRLGQIDARVATLCVRPSPLLTGESDLMLQRITHPCGIDCEPPPPPPPADTFRPGIVGMRGSMAIRLRPCMNIDSPPSVCPGPPLTDSAGYLLVALRAVTRHLPPTLGWIVIPEVAHVYPLRFNPSAPVPPLSLDREIFLQSKARFPAIQLKGGAQLNVRNTTNRFCRTFCGKKRDAFEMLRTNGESNGFD